MSKKWEGPGFFGLLLLKPAFICLNSSQQEAARSRAHSSGSAAQDLFSGASKEGPFSGLVSKVSSPLLAVHPGPFSLLRRGDHDRQREKEGMSTEPASNEGAKEKIHKDFSREEI